MNPNHPIASAPKAASSSARVASVSWKRAEGGAEDAKELAEGLPGYLLGPILLPVTVDDDS